MDRGSDDVHDAVPSTPQGPYTIVIRIRRGRRRLNAFACFYGERGAFRKGKLVLTGSALGHPLTGVMRLRRWPRHSARLVPYNITLVDQIGLSREQAEQFVAELFEQRGTQLRITTKKEREEGGWVFQLLNAIFEEEDD